MTDEKIRMVVYVLFGAVPATFIAAMTVFFSHGSWLVGPVLIGLTGLWISCFVDPRQIGKAGWIVSALLLVGIATMGFIPASLLISILRDPSSLSDLIRLDWNTLLLFWFFIFPVAVAIHFILRWAMALFGESTRN